MLTSEVDDDVLSSLVIDYVEELRKTNPDDVLDQQAF